MGAIKSQITSLTIVYSTVYSDAYQRKHQISASLAFVRGITVTGEFLAQMARMVPFDDVIVDASHSKMYVLAEYIMALMPCYVLGTLLSRIATIMSNPSQALNTYGERSTGVSKGPSLNASTVRPLV